MLSMMYCMAIVSEQLHIDSQVFAQVLRVDFFGDSGRMSEEKVAVFSFLSRKQSTPRQGQGSPRPRRGQSRARQGKAKAAQSSQGSPVQPRQRRGYSLEMSKNSLFTDWANWIQV
ncbi:hypothetical protein RHMOL_Rhmol03G0081200 [Rhododendron molle]|uniref:Uncharacterized protein n=1 Tax=Rhododendron molle TaxID=49168 RepID=A0ACC0PE35_RHOML|nr:hypothetical protein RHMOL_Rhmol03G0081200 [Rhododendron molle]